jgi:glycosyltransferase involved in cell wall biosynthesis
MKIALMGIRGIPANYGGFETFAEELSTRLVARGHDVTVYGRSNIIDYKAKYYKGVELVILPTISHKYFDTVAHTFLCAWHSLFRKFDVILICNSANSVFALIPRIGFKKVAINVDGLEWQRAKWNIFGKWYYQLSEWIATFSANRIVTDSIYIRQYYLEKFKKDSMFIPYGAPTERAKTMEIFNKFDVEPGKYVLYVSRMEPENNAHVVVKAFEKAKTDLKLVMVGDAPYSNEYIRKLKSTKDPRIIFTGYVFGQGYREFQSNAYFYVQATEVGGTHPALLEGMGYGNCVLANDVPEHREVLRRAGVYFNAKDVDNLAERMQWLLDNPDVVAEHRKKSVERILEAYTWDRITESYEKLFEEMCNHKE